MAKGSIGVTTNNIFPVIKKFLYSDHEIFLRELVSNAVDASQKLKTLASAGDFNGSTDGLKVSVALDKEAGTLNVSDNGIGMTADEIDRYINQIAFSGAEEFLSKYKDNANAIIGHFGLGFYSAFMVAKKVEIRTLSWQEGAKAVCWSCDGSPEYEMNECDKAERGTDIVVYIDDDEKEFLEASRISASASAFVATSAAFLSCDGLVSPTFGHSRTAFVAATYATYAFLSGGGVFFSSGPISPLGASQSNIAHPAISARDETRIAFVSFHILHLLLSLAAAGRVIHIRFRPVLTYDNGRTLLEYLNQRTSITLPWTI